jgi:hypothetical protein
MRFLYVRLLRMHPAAFRESFATEMLWIFDETAHVENPIALLLDCSVSLFRQWILRSGLWRIIPAIAGASLQFGAISLCWHFPRIVPCSAHSAAPIAHAASGMGLLAITLVVATARTVVVVALRAAKRATAANG